MTMFVTVLCVSAALVGFCVLAAVATIYALAGALWATRTARRRVSEWRESRA